MSKMANHRVILKEIMKDDDRVVMFNDQNEVLCLIMEDGNNFKFYFSLFLIMLLLILYV